MPRTAPFSSLRCAIFLIAAYAQPVWSNPCFDDENLAQLGLLSPVGALVYVWSPRMVLSAQHAASAQRQARQQGLVFVPLHDGRVGDGEIQSALTQLAGPGDASLAASAQALARSQSLCAPGLLARDALRHFPTAFVVQGTDTHRHPIVGAMPESAWAHSIALRLHRSQARP
jgi:hypothetical protein